MNEGFWANMNCVTCHILLAAYFLKRVIHVTFRSCCLSKIDIQANYVFVCVCACGAAQNSMSNYNVSRVRPARLFRAVVMDKKAVFKKHLR